MTDELPPDIRALLADGRAHLGPDHAAIARLRMRVAAGVGKGVMGATVVKVALLGVAIASTGAIAYALRRAPANAGSSSAPVIDVAGSASAGDASHAVAYELRSQRDVAPKLHEIAASAPAAKRIVVEPIPPPSSSSPPEVASTPAPPSAHVALSREIQLIDDATRALHRADFPRATAIIHTYDAETAGAGQLAEDAAAIAIEAACGEHTDVTTQLARFTQRWPRSAQLARIGVACPGVKP